MGLCDPDRAGDAGGAGDGREDVLVMDEKGGAFWGAFIGGVVVDILAVLVLIWIHAAWLH